MKWIALAAAFWAGPSFAADTQPPYQITDKAIIGEYALQPANAKSDVRSAKIYYTTDNELSLYVDAIGDFSLHAADSDGLVGDVENEAPDCDQDETACGYVESAKAYLQKSADGRPQILITATQSVYDSANSSEGNPIYNEEDDVYTLVWSKALPHDGLPVISYDKKDAETANYLKTCQPLAKGFYDDPSDQVFCPQIRVDDVKFTMKEGVDYVIGGWLRGGAKAASYDDLVGSFFKLALQNIADAQAKGSSKKVADQLRAQVAQLQQLFQDKAKTSEFYYYHASYGDTAWIADSATRSIYSFSYYSLRR